MDKILLFGGGGHGKACVDVIESSGEFEISGIVDPLLQKMDLPYTLINKENPYEFLRETFDNAIVSVGQIKNFASRSILGWGTLSLYLNSIRLRGNH